MLPRIRARLVTVLSLCSILSFTLIFSFYLSLYGKKNFLFIDGDQLQLKPDNSRIFFMETSLKNSLNFKQTCAVESAALHHPHRSVQLLLTTKTADKSSVSFEILRHYPNVLVILVTPYLYFKNTPLEEWFSKAFWRTSIYSVEHLSDYMRILTVFNGGGQYLDLDFIVTKRFDDHPKLRNYVTYQNSEELSNGAFHFDHKHPILNKLIEFLKAFYDPEEWEQHGPILFDRVMYRYCSAEGRMAQGPNCGKINLIGPSVFYPFSYEDRAFLFNRVNSTKHEEKLKKAFAVHAWNKVTSTEEVAVGTEQIYAKLAKVNCPITYSLASAFNISS